MLLKRDAEGTVKAVDDAKVVVYAQVRAWVTGWDGIGW
jgi:hypothetical protein